MIQGHVLDNSGSKEDAFDVFQDALIIIFEKARSNQFTLTSSFQTFLFSVARFVWLNKLKKNRREVITSDFDESLIDNKAEWADMLIEERKQRLFWSKLNVLSEECQRLLQLSWKGKSGKEIAQAMNYSVEFVKRKRHRCKTALINKIQNDTAFHIVYEAINK